ncbi:MAG TPA: cation diffusion facilitator family transporter [Thermoanaerobaculia bacterium]
MEPSVDTRARRVALNVSGAALLLAAAKAAVGLAAGSIALLSSALDSAGDMLASFANYMFLTLASKPPDEEHQFGHGKAEHLAALLQGVILMAGAVTLGIRAAERIRHPVKIEANVVAIITMVASIVATIVVTRYLKRNAVRSESSALASDALHYTSDIVANIATIAALVLVRVTGNALFDSIFGVSVACWIAWNSLYLIWNAGNDLMDPALPDHEVARLIEAIERADPAVVNYRELRTRKAAGVRFVEFELCIDRRVSFDRAHEATEIVKQKIREAFPRTIITVHAEPVDV